MSTKPAPLIRSRVVTAIYDLAGRLDRWPTLVELAEYLQAPPPEVQEHLNELIRRRMFRMRRRDDRNVWMPWDQV